MNRAEMEQRLDEFRDLWVVQLLDVRTVAERMGMTANAVNHWSREMGLSIERQEAKAALGCSRKRWLERQKRIRDQRRQTDPRRYVPPEGGCRNCKLIQDCKDKRLWLTDRGMPCELLLPDEQRAVENGGYERSTPPGRTPLAVRVEIDFGNRK